MTGNARGLGAACATSLCPGVRSRVRGRKLSLFSHQLCWSRRQSRACPGRGQDSAHTPALGLQQRPGVAGREGHARVLDSQAPSPPG